MGLLAGNSKVLKLQPAAAGANLGISVDEQLGSRVGGDDRADIPAVDDGTGPLGGEIALELEQRRAYLRDGRDLRCLAAHQIAADRHIPRARQVYGPGSRA